MAAPLRSLAGRRGFSFDDDVPVPAPGGDKQLYVRPLGILHGVAAERAVVEGWARPLAGSPAAFAAVEVIVRDGQDLSSAVGSLETALEWAEKRRLDVVLDQRLQMLSRARRRFAGLDLDRPLIMGVVNVTPDSFSDGGDFARAEAAVTQGRALADAGADIIDIGGESTRPGAEEISEADELGRVLPVVAALAGDDICVSIDTRRAGVMRDAVAAGARLVNDVSALTGDPESLTTAAELGVPVVLMHMRGDPKTMQDDPRYADVAADVFDYLAKRVTAAERAGLARAQIAVDPGIGFGKTLDHNLALLDQLALFHGLGCALVLGVSRKSFIARLSRGEPAKGRVPGTIAANLAGLQRGAQIVRVHDVAEAAQALAVWNAIAAGSDT